MKEIIIVLLLFYSNVSFSQTEDSGLVMSNYLEKAELYYKKNKKDSALFYAIKALDLGKVLRIDSLQIKAFLALAEFEKDNQIKLDHYSNAEQLAKKNEYFNLLAQIYYGRAEFFYHNDKNKVAFSDYIRLDSLANINKIDPFLSTRAKIRLAGLLFRDSNWTDVGQFPQIEKHINEGLKICDSFGLTSSAAYLYLQKGVLNKMRNNFPEALNAYNKALEITKVSQNYVRMATIYIDIGSMYAYRLRQEDSAEVNYLRGMKINALHNDTLHLAEMNLQTANFYNIYSNPKNALKYLEAAKELLKNRSDVRRERLFKLNDVATNIYFKLGMLDSAFAKSKEANRLFVEMTKTRNKENIANLEARYQTEKKEQQIVLLGSQNQLIEQQKSNQRNIFLASLLITSLLGVSLFVLYRSRQKTNNKLKELDAFKTNLFTNISHELRTPLTLISGPIEKQLSNPDIPNNAKKELQLVQNNSDRLLHLIDQMTDLAKVDSGQIKLDIKQGNIYNLLTQQLAAFQFKAEQSDIQLNHSIKKMDDAWFDADVVQKISSNLITNAINYVAKDTTIKVEASQKDGLLHFSVKNSVADLSEKDLNQLFERFYQVDSNSKGMGVGLALVKELVALHKGAIDVLTNPESEIEFIVSLPIEKEAFNIAEQYNAVTFEEENEYQKEIEASEEDESLLLIVEDDPDVRAFVSSIFEDQYKIIEASNGKEGVDKAVESIPDLIVSDVMMPEMDGLELTQKLKNDERTSHIPIILLTAKVGDANASEGIDAGADDYISKPFKNKLLIAKVNRLITTRKQFQDRYSQEIVLRPADIAISSTDEQFLNKVQSILDTKLIESTFTAEEFSQSLGMNRMQLHRKLKAITGQSTSQFIRSQRLKLAAELLKTSDTIVSQAGYAVGFSDHSYFTKCFKKQFGSTPTEYAKGLN